MEAEFDEGVMEEERVYVVNVKRKQVKEKGIRMNER
jgi:hypothetical protein